MSNKTKKLLILNLPYFIAGLVCTNLGEAWRIAEGADMSEKLLGFLSALGAAFSNPMPSLHPMDLLIGVCCGAGLRLAVYLKGKNAKKYGTNYQKVGHDLASVDELAVLDGGKCILQLRGVRPFKSDKYDLTQHPNYKLTAGADKKNTFSIEAFLDHRLKLKPGDKYEVVDADHAK